MEFTLELPPVVLFAAACVVGAVLYLAIGSLTAGLMRRFSCSTNSDRWQYDHSPERAVIVGLWPFLLVFFALAMIGKTLWTPFEWLYQMVGGKSVE